MAHSVPDSETAIYPSVWWGRVGTLWEPKDLARPDETVFQDPSACRGLEPLHLSAAGSLTLLPVIAFALLVQRHIQSGMTLGAVKG